MAYDVKKLVKKLKEGGMEVAEDGAKLIVNSTLDWLKESAIESESPIDDILVPVIAAARPYIDKELDKIDGKVG